MWPEERALFKSVGQHRHAPGTSSPSASLRNVALPTDGSTRSASGVGPADHQKSLGTHDPKAARIWAYLLSARYAQIFARGTAMATDSKNGTRTLGHRRGRSNFEREVETNLSITFVRSVPMAQSGLRLMVWTTTSVLWRLGPRWIRPRRPGLLKSPTPAHSRVP